jgi:hypothetical protein
MGNMHQAVLVLRLHNKERTPLKAAPAHAEQTNQPSPQAQRPASRQGAGHAQVAERGPAHGARLCLRPARTAAAAPTWAWRGRAPATPGSGWAPRAPAAVAAGADAPGSEPPASAASHHARFRDISPDTAVVPALRRAPVGRKMPYQYLP